MTAGVAMLNLYCWLISLKQQVDQFGSSSLPAVLAIVTDKVRQLAISLELQHKLCKVPHNLTRSCKLSLCCWLVSLKQQVDQFGSSSLLAVLAIATDKVRLCQFSTAQSLFNPPTPSGLDVSCKLRLECGLMSLSSRWTSLAAAPSLLSRRYH